MTTPLLKHILLATDFSADARRAQDFAIGLAKVWEAELDILHVIEPKRAAGEDAESFALAGRSRSDAARQLEAVRDDVARQGISARPRLLLGNPVEHIHQVAREQDIDLVVLGLQGRNNLAYGLIGSTAERLVHDGPCPILAVPGLRKDALDPLPADTPAVISRILAPLDFSAPSMDAVEYAVHLTKKAGATLTLVHVLEANSYDLDCGLGVIEDEDSKRDYWDRQLMDLREVVSADGIPVDVEISGGLPADAILACALRCQADLIVMGTHGRRGRSPERFGSVAEAVLRRATRPVLTLKTARFTPDHRRVVPLALDRQTATGEK